MTGILKVDQWKDSGDNALMTSDGAGNLTLNQNIQTPVGSAASPALQIGDNDTGIFDAGANAIGFTTAGTEKVRIVSGGSVAIGATSAAQKLHVEGSIYTSGSLYVGGTGSANALDDYETGTWTPVFTGETSAGSYTYSFNNGYYTKIGDIVHASFRLINITDVSAGSGNVIITGLPFTVANDGVPNHQSVWTTYFTASTDSDWQLSLDNNTTQFRFRRLNSGTGITMQVSDKTSNLADIYTLFTYRVA